MKKEIVIAGILGIIIGIVVAPTLGGMWGGGWMMNGRFNKNVSYGPGMMGGVIDRHFIEQMIPHHEGAIAMAKLALQESERPEILSLSENIIDAQTREIDQMRDWYRDWFGAEIPENAWGMMGHGGMMHMGSFEGDLTALAAAPDFDLEFIRQMVPHHEMAVMMARMLGAATDRAEMKVFAEQIITSQSREIDMMESWYDAWSKH